MRIEVIGNANREVDNSNVIMYILTIIDCFSNKKLVMYYIRKTDI